MDACVSASLSDGYIIAAVLYISAGYKPSCSLHVQVYVWLQHLVKRIFMK